MLLGFAKCAPLDVNRQLTQRLRQELSQPPCSAAPLPAGERWWKDGAGNFSVPVPGPKKAEHRKGSLGGFEDELSRIIVDAEVNSGAWTLMHRCNKASDLINEVLSVS